VIKRRHFISSCPRIQEREKSTAENESQGEREREEQ